MTPALRGARPVVVLALLAGLVVSLLAGPAAATTTTDDTGEVTVDILPVDGYLDPPTADAIRALLDDAAERGSGLVVLQLDHRGAVSVDTAALADDIAASAVPVVVFARPGGTAPALAGGALELLAAADVRAASPDALLGPLAPLDVADPVDATSEAAAVARLEARWPEGATLFADDPGATQLFADDPAATAALDLLARELEPLLVELDGVTVTGPDGTTQELRLRSTEVSVRFHSLGLLGRLLHAATTPAFIYLLLVVGLGMLLFEVFQPGFGVAGVAGIVTVAIGVFGLTVLPVTWWAVALVVLGLLLYALDTAVAGFGAVTALATVTFAAGSYWFYDSDVIAVDPWLVGLTTLTALVFFVIVMTVVLRAQAGPDDVAVEELVGRPGIVRSVLNPEGHVFIADALWRARWTGEGRRRKVGSPVRVHGVDGAVLLVEAFDPAGGSDQAPGARAPADGDDVTVPDTRSDA
jgi:membrane-bound serine protease (ClpP class)